MKIKILKSCSGYSFSFKQGDTVDIEDYIGKDLIDCGFAEAVKNTAKSTAKKKTKAAEAAEDTESGNADA